MIRKTIQGLVHDIAHGQKYRIRVVFANGSCYENTPTGQPDVTIIFRKRSAEWRMVCGGIFEFLESYFSGAVDLEGEHALQRLINIAFRQPYGRLEPPLTWVKRHYLEWRDNNRHLRQAKQNATYHYGLPMAFFHLLLGDTYGYTEGCWREDTQTLEQAQHNNFDDICRKLQLQPGDKLVEIGSGWGYMAMLAAEKYGVEVTNYGLVRRQNDGMRERMAGHPGADKIHIVEKDHRELEHEPGKYDKYVSIGVHEHAGKDCNEDWIRSIATGLRDGGRGLISATFNIGKKPTNYCTIKHIFPGGLFPSLAETLLLMEKHGLTVHAVENRSYHYHRTLQAWLRNFEAHWEQIRQIDPQIFTEQFRRTWLFYLSGSVETFEATHETLNCFHITFTKERLQRSGCGTA